ncbi:MAG: CidA/LrgA family protein [Lawsonibacter sp.]|jgi:putative effector of murein hydrolase LrgA (UPF0299 family)|nr:CidA/LrgA family protein [Lawsonibacter sp.]
MNIMGELAILFGVCLAAEGIAALLPVPFPASVIGMLLLLGLLLCRGVKERHICRACGFLSDNMSFFFVAPCVGLLKYADHLMECLLPFVFIAIITTPIVYFATAWTIQLTLALRRRKGKHHD